MQTIDITTTQNVTIEYELATLRERGMAVVIDALAVMVMSVFIVLIFGDEHYYFEDQTIMMIVLGAILFIFYQLFSEIIANGKSWGKKAMGIKVVRLDGKEAGLGDYLLRATFHLIDTLFPLGIVGGVLIGSTNKSQRLGDMAASTTVIRSNYSLRFKLDDILKINTVDDYEPIYPEVKNLNEQDMLLIKNIITRYRKHPNEAHRSVVNKVAKHVAGLLEIQTIPKDKIAFLKTLIRDYIVLTR